jgi:hypothetical protein
MKQVMGIFLAAMALCLFAGWAHGEQRSPFVEPADKVNPYNYEKAIQQVMVKGIVRIEGAERVMVRIADIKGLAVLKPGDRFALDYRGLTHVFTVGEIKTHSVRFQACLDSETREGQKAPKGEVLEVFVR